MKTIHKISGIFLWCVVGVFLGKSVYTYYDYTAHPGLYETWSAPWYTGILRDGVIAAVSDCGDAGGSVGDSKKNEEGIEGDDF